MGRRRTRTSAWWITWCGVLVLTGVAVAEPTIAHQTPGEVPLCLLPAGRPGSEGSLLVGYASGCVRRLSLAGEQLRVSRQVNVNGAVLALMELSPAEQSGPDVIASTAIGHVVCFRGDAADPAWRFESTCEVSSLAELPDVDGDRTPEVVAAGADQRVHLLSGRTGKALWSRLLESKDGNTNVMRLQVGPDQDGDGTPDIVAWLWNGELAALSGRSGNPIWRKPIGGGFTEALAIGPDLNRDALCEFVVGGNDCTVRACSGRDGTVLWSGQVERPIRDVVVSIAGDPTGDSPGAETKSADGTRYAFDAAVYACTAGGEVARFHLDPKNATNKPAWTANLGDVCRDVVVTADVDRDQVQDVAACAENGVVAIVSGKTGQVLRRWQVPDVVRAICPIAAGDRSYIAAAGLDSAVHLLPIVGGDAATTEAAAPTTRPALAQRNDGPQPANRNLAREAAGYSHAPRVIILLYHDILPEVFNHYATSVANFRAHMDMLVREKYVCVSLDEIADWIERKFEMPDRAVCITFDGQYQGQYTYAYPILWERGLFATSYITTDWIGTPDHSDWDQIREMDAAGVLDAQNHTINHPSLTRCDRTEIVAQLAACNDAIRRHLDGKTARHHAYPSGAYNDEVIAVVREQGFRTATTVRAGPVTRDDGRLSLPRYTLCTHKTLEEFHAWLTGVER